MAEITEKKSRFIATVRAVNTEEEASLFLAEMKKQYWDARHNCYAVTIGDNNEFTRCSDDGEPAGSAGRPMLDVLLGEEIHNVAVVVTRYFGGVLLGTGGLVRAYQGAVKKALEFGDIVVKKTGIRHIIRAEYTYLTGINRILEKHDCEVIDTDYSDKISIEVIIEKDSVEKCIKEIIELSAGTAAIEENEECDMFRKMETQTS